MEVDPKSLFQKTEEIHKPSLLDMMKASTPAEFENIKADESKGKRKVLCFAVLTPALAQVVQNTNMKPDELHCTIVQHLKINLPVNPAPTTTTPIAPQDTDTILTDARKNYE